VLLALLTLFASSRSPHDRPTSALNDLLADIRQVDLSQWVVYQSHLPSEISDSVGDYRLGPVRWEQLEYRCQRAGSNFGPSMQAFKGRFAIERGPFSVAVISLDRLQRAPFALVSRDMQLRFSDLVDGYFSAIAEHFLRQLPSDLSDAQAMPAALGSNFFPDYFLRFLGHSDVVSVFLNADSKGRGWVIPTFLGHLLVSPGTDTLSLKLAEQRLNGIFGWTGADDTSLDPLLTVFSPVVKQGRELRLEGRLITPSFTSSLPSR